MHTNSALGSDDTHNIGESDNVTKTTAEGMLEHLDNNSMRLAQHITHNYTEADMDNRTSYIAIASSVSAILVAGALIAISLVIMIVVFLQRRRKKRYK